jgi:Ca2+-binding RTX toxin-like protein
VENLTLTDTAINGIGNGGNNIIIGNANDNTLRGGAGSDTLTGGLGNDVFVFSNVSEAGDNITDFSVIDDKLRLTGVFPSPSPFTDFQNAKDLGYLILTGNQVQVDIDGSGPGTAITLATLNVSATLLTSTNFVF